MDEGKSGVSCKGHTHACTVHLECRLSGIRKNMKHTQAEVTINSGKEIKYRFPFTVRVIIVAKI